MKRNKHITVEHVQTAAAADSFARALNGFSLDAIVKSINLSLGGHDPSLGIDNGGVSKSDHLLIISGIELFVAVFLLAIIIHLVLFQFRNQTSVKHL